MSDLWIRRNVTIGQRFRRKTDGRVVIVAQMHRKDKTVECFWADRIEEMEWPARFQIKYGDLRRDFERLTPIGEAA